MSAETIAWEIECARKDLNRLMTQAWREGLRVECDVDWHHDMARRWPEPCVQVAVFKRMDPAQDSDF